MSPVKPVQETLYFAQPSLCCILYSSPGWGILPGCKNLGAVSSVSIHLYQK